MKRLPVLLSAIVLIYTTLWGAEYDVENTDAVFLEINKTYTLNPDGTTRFDYHHRVKLLTYRATSGLFGESFIVFNPRFQTLIIDTASTTMLDGKIINSPANAFNDVLPGAFADAPDWGYMVERVISHTGLERGSVVDFKYHIDTKADFQPWLWAEDIFSQPQPIAKMKVSVRLPKGTILHHATRNGALSFTQKEDDGCTVYSWAMEKIPAWYPETSQAPANIYAPKVTFSTCPSWDDLRSFILDRINQSMSQESPMLDSFIDFQSDISPLQTLLDLRQKTVQELKTIRFDPALTGYRFDNVATILTRNYASEWEKALLLKKMMMRRGFSADLVLQSDDPYLSEKVPLLYVFKPLLVQAKTNDGQSYLFSPIHEHNNQLETEYQGSTLWQVSRDNALPEMLPLSSIASRKITCKFDLDEKNQLVGKIEFYLSGNTLPYYDLLEKQSQEQFTQKQIDALWENGIVDNVSVVALSRESICVQADIHAPQKVKELTNTSICAFQPLKLIGQELHLSMAATSRLTPVKLDAPYLMDLDLKLSLRQGFKWQQIFSPTAVYVSPANQNLPGVVQLKIVSDDSVLSIHFATEIQKTIVPVEQYNHVRTLCREFNQARETVFYFTKRTNNSGVQSLE